MPLEKGCKKIVDLMVLAYDNALPPGKRDEFEEHLKHCASCQKRWIYYRFIATTSKQLPRFHMNHLGEQRLLRTLSRATPPPRVTPAPLFPWRVAGLGLAGATALFAFLLLTSPPGSYQPRILEARKNPHPAIFLRDPRSGTWLRPFELVNYWFRSQKPVQILPRINPHHPRAQEEYRIRLEQLQSSLSQLAPSLEVEYLPPQTADTPRTEPVEFWVITP